MYQIIQTKTDPDEIIVVYEQQSPIVELENSFVTEAGEFSKFDGLSLVVIPDYPKVTPIQYKLLFTSAERIAIATARKTDPVLEDLYSILDDARLTEVDLALQSTKDALDYLTFKGLIAAGRKEQILTGTLL